jgi:transcription elongation factor Elf1
MDYVDMKYINLLSLRLDKFKRVKNNLYNFRCPICGDSQKNKTKARGYFYGIKNNTNYKCHNCGINISFHNFLKKMDIVLYKEYTFEKYKTGTTGKNFQTKDPEFKFKPPEFNQKINLDKASENPRSNEYLKSRKLNPYKFYYAPKFKEWTNSLVETFDDLRYDEERIVIPLYYNKKLIGFQGRSIGPSLVKYITIMLDEDSPKIYGLDEIDQNETIYVTEGPFDSTFLKNSIAMCGADADVSKFEWKKVVYVYDNEPRNKEIVKRISNMIDNGFNVVIWPSNILEKDINDMVMSGLNVQDIVECNTYQGLEAKLKFTNWKRV